MSANMFPRILSAALLLCVASSAWAADAPALKQGDRIVFLGDSITQGGVGPKGYVTVIKNAINDKYKDLGVETIGAGISGNKVPDLQRRVDKDVIAKKPTIVVIYIGINDVWHGEKDPAKGTTPDKFEAGLKEVIGKCSAAGARVVLCTPSVIGEKNDGSNSLDAKLDEYAGISKKVAEELKLDLCDLRGAFLAHLKANNADNKDKGILTGDRVHLNEAGNKFVAETMLPHLDAAFKKPQ
jgi:lysophospholipase L1-like esterase